MMVSRLLTPTYCTHTKMFLKEVGIISSEVNVTFDEYIEELSFDSEDASNELNINMDWKSRNQITIDQRKKQLEQ